MKLKDLTKEHVCHYGHRFLAKEAKLIPFKNESREILGHVIFVDTEDQKVFRGGRAPEGYFMACPHCGIIHVGGFVSPSEKQLQDKQSEEPKRNIQLHL